MERKAADLIADFEERSRQAIEEIRLKAEQRKAAEKAAEQAQLAASRAARGMKEALQGAVQPAAAAGDAAKGRKLEEGARVKIQGVREPARVKRILSGGKVEVEAGFLKLQIPEADVLEVLPPGEAGAKLPKGVSFSAGPSWTLSEREVNVIGKTAEEAREEIERFIDRASLASVDRIRIVHGHGMGVLKRMVAEMLGKHPLVDRVEAATQGEGGSGATIAWLRA
jgi:DNA mismatch repair protein MutS2